MGVEDKEYRTGTLDMLSEHPTYHAVRLYQSACGLSPGRRQTRWLFSETSEINCKRCLKKLENKAWRKYTNPLSRNSYERRV